MSLHELRRALGDDALQSQGDDVVLNAAVISTDVDAFLSANQSRDYETAVTWYAGPFMDGFFASDAPELERWIDGERDQLARTYSNALEQCARARAANGDTNAAVDAWRRLAALDPYHARIARELILALDAAGDRAGALQHARVHTTLMQEEFGAEPDPEIMALVEKLRTAPTRAAPVSFASPPAPIASPPAPIPLQPAPVVQQIPTQAGAVKVTPREPTRSPSKSRARARRRRTSWLVGALVVVGMLSVSRVVIGWVRRAPQPASIAVVPFGSIPEDDSLRAFADGVSEGILSALSKVNGLQVSSASSSFLLRGRGSREVGERLTVGSVLEGSVRADPGRITVTARLVEASTENVKWDADYHFPRDMRNVLIVQDSIARAVATALGSALLRDGSDSGAAVPILGPTTQNPTAFTLHQSGLFHFRRRNPLALDTALQFFQKATEADPRYALPYAAMAEVYTILGAYDYGRLAPRDAFPKAKQAAEQALRLADNLAEAHAALGAVYFNYEWNWKAAEEHFKKALELNGGYAPAYHWYSLLLATQNKMKPARDAIEQARVHDPLSEVVNTSFARHLYFDRRNDDALEAYRNVLAREPSFVTADAGIGLVFVQLKQYDSAIAHYKAAAAKIGRMTPLLHGLLAHSYGLAKRNQEARAELNALQSMRRGTYVPPEYLVLAYIGLGENDNALSSLEAAFEAQSGGIAYLNIEPLLDPLRNSPRFQALVKKARLR
ncbi:MAG: BTAD domain-containing putative transcriptional regulator [Gemmatimonadota bacterium]